MNTNISITLFRFGLVILFLLVFNKKIYSQDKLDSLIKEHFYAGLGVGPETGMSGMFPKISYYNFKVRKRIERYYGFEGSIWIVGAAMFSADILYGIKKNSLTLDNSIGIWRYPKTEKTDYKDSYGPYFHATLNPKIGIKFWKLWIKAGPSIFIFKDYPKNQEKLKFMDITKIGKNYYNFEILVKI